VRRKWELVDGQSFYPCAGWRVSSQPASSIRLAIPDFLALTKPEVNFLIIIATFSGFYLGYPGDCTTSQQMRRTSRRPIGGGETSPPSSRMVRHVAFDSWLCLPSRQGERTRACSCSVHGRYLSAHLHTPEKENAALHIGGRCSGRHACADRLGGGI
jgi:hypothetical protein